MSDISYEKTPSSGAVAPALLAPLNNINGECPATNVSSWSAYIGELPSPKSSHTPCDRLVGLRQTALNYAANHVSPSASEVLHQLYLYVV